MPKKRGHGEGGLYWDEKRQRFTSEVTVGYSPAGKRIVRRGRGKTVTEARAKLKEVLRDYEDGLAVGPQNYTVADAVTDWLAYGLNDHAGSTIEKCTILCTKHIVPALGKRKLRELSATDVDRWLAAKAKTLSTRTVREVYACLNRAVNRAMARDNVKRNVVALCSLPKGTVGRPSKSLTFDQAKAVIRASIGNALNAYVVVALLTGARTEELRALTWNHVDLDGQADVKSPVPPSMQVWRSVRVGGDTKTRKSRRTIALPKRCVAALRAHKERQAQQREKAGKDWHDTGLVFASSVGTELDAANVRRAFRTVVKMAGLNAMEWSPRELRHSFVSLLSDNGMTLEKIADLVGHSGTSVTEKVYRHQLRPVLQDGAVVMDEIFTEDDPEDGE